ncbi:hypothetical protein M2138_001842 [Dysgonomonadaceae bacterium PH5-43]|nr:hypothetical protein [Dysgonomonadaceae bacterium PH5-43]
MQQRTHLIRLFFLVIVFISVSFDGYTNDSISVKRPQFISLKVNQGTVLSTNSFIWGDNKIPYYGSADIRYGFSPKGDNWKDYAYGMPYMGVGVYVANFQRKKDLGTPVSLFFFQGGNLLNYTEKVSLNYEWNAGLAFNWKPYDAFTNPNNVAIGSAVNIHAAVNLYMNWKLTKNFHLNVGVEFDHFSNAASRLPNRGVNLVSGFVDLTYHFNNEDFKYTPSLYDKPEFKTTREHDFMALVSSRNVEVDTVGTGLPDKYVRQNFIVLGASYAYMFNDNYRYRWGPSVEVTYDESAGAKQWREVNELNGRTYDRVKLDKFFNRFSVGVSVKGEINVARFSGFLNLGYDVIHARKEDGRFYQIFGIKVFLKENLFGVFGVRTTNFGRSQYPFLNLGYTIK